MALLGAALLCGIGGPLSLLTGDRDWRACLMRSYPAREVINKRSGGSRGHERIDDHVLVEGRRDMLMVR